MENLGHESIPYSPYENPSADWEAIVSTTTTMEGDDVQESVHGGLELSLLDTVSYVFCMVTLAFFCYCSRSRVPDERFRIEAAERRARWRERQQRKERMSDPDYRINLVNKAIVIKKVIEEKGGQLILDDVIDEEDDQGSSGGSISIDSMDENTSTCVICLEAFRVGDVVAMSRTLLESSQEETCNHVFHRECIMSWLMSPTHDECPSCRSSIVRENEENLNQEEEDGSRGSGRRRFEKSAFVIMHGLVSRVRRASYSLIGQSIDIHGDHEEKETDQPHIKVPPSPLRRVVSLEGSASADRRFSLRRRPSSGSIESRISVASAVALPDVTEDGSEVLSRIPSPSPLRRVLSDTSRIPPSAAIALTRQSPVGRRFLLAMRPSRASYRRVSSFNSEEHSERSLDQEDDILIRHDSLQDLEQALDESTDDENSTFDDEPCYS